MGDSHQLAALPVGPVAAADAVEASMERLRFHSFERLDAVVEGHRAAVRWRIVVSAPDTAPIEAQLFDLWTFDDQYRATELVQFTDTR